MVIFLKKSSIFKFGKEIKKTKKQNELCLKFQNKIRELFVCVLLVCCFALLASTYIHINYYYWTPSIFKTKKKKIALIRYLIWPKLIVVFTYPILPLIIVYYWYLFLATWGRTVSFIVDILLFVVSWYDLYIIYICGVFTVVLIVSIFLFFLFLFFFWLSPYLSFPNPRFVYLVYFLSLCSYIFIFFFCLSFLSISIPFSSLFVLSPSLFV
jgi:hypothetical protein